MAKCSECGYLASRNYQSRELDETEKQTRDTGNRAKMVGYGVYLYEPPVCFTQTYDLWSESSDPGDHVYLINTICKERDCNSFIKWHQGFTPKEHWEMAEREKSLNWQNKQRKEDKRWRIIELIVFGIIAVVIAGGFTVLGAFIERGSLFSSDNNSSSSNIAPPHP